MASFHKTLSYDTHEKNEVILKYWGCREKMKLKSCRPK